MPLVRWGSPVSLLLQGSDAAHVVLWSILDDKTVPHGPVGLVVGFLADIHPFLFVAAIPGKTWHMPCGVKAAVRYLKGGIYILDVGSVGGEKNKNDPAGF